MSSTAGRRASRGPCRSLRWDAMHELLVIANSNSALFDATVRRCLDGGLNRLWPGAFACKKVKGTPRQSKASSDRGQHSAVVGCRCVELCCARGTQAAATGVGRGIRRSVVFNRAGHQGTIRPGRSRLTGGSAVVGADVEGKEHGEMYGYQQVGNSWVRVADGAK